MCAAKRRKLFSLRSMVCPHIRELSLGIKLAVCASP
uniref:Uncharacterized protein n=1 Tax=Anguilla anguilla TaxID=7936 RepID=A0A0E9WQV4_ANGAN